MSSDFVTRRRLENLHFPKYTLPLVYGQEITTRLFNGFIYLVTYPLRFHRRCEHHTHPEALSCTLCVPAIAALPTLSHGSAIVAPPSIPAVCHRSFPAQPVGMPRLASTTYYAMPYPYRWTRRERSLHSTQKLLHPVQHLQQQHTTRST
jgi:hypothetical protein